MPAYHDEESFMQALDNGLIDREEASSHMKYSGPIIDLTHLAEDPAPANDTNETDNDFDPPSADLLRA